MDGTSWLISFITKEFAQRAVRTLKDNDTVFEGMWHMCDEQGNWSADLRITYRLRPPE